MFDPAAPPPLVTVLSGFLGAGKTTLLNHLLTQAAGERWALVVNDVGAINIDAQLVARQAAAVAGGGETQRVVELGNGCVCCSIKDELAETVAELCALGRYERVLIEATGVAEPLGIANLFLRKNPFGRSLSDFGILHSLVTVVDAVQFLREARTNRRASSAAGGPATPTPRGSAAEAASAASPRREIVELLVEQVECADLLILNKCDLATETELAEAEEILRALNVRAEIFRAERGQVPREIVLDRARFDAKETLGAARWIRALNAAAPGAGWRPGVSAMPQGNFVEKPRTGAQQTEPDFAAKYGLVTFVFQARRPFRREAFESLFARGIPGLVRAKGFFWLHERPDEMGLVSVAAGVVRYDWLHYWWAALVENGRVRREEAPAAIEALWVEPAGDRRQELVFIGVQLDEAIVRTALENCFA